MADEDEELSHLRAPDANDIDLTEETQDFRFFNKLTFVRMPVPRREAPMLIQQQQ
jgi:hypothetical protein